MVGFGADGLEAHVGTDRLVEVVTGGVDLELEINAAAGEINTIEDRWTKLGEGGGGVALELEGKLVVNREE